MNSKKCKQLRAMFYGDLSQKIERIYTHDNRANQSTNNGVTISNHPESPRGRYLAAKRQYKFRRQSR